MNAHKMRSPTAADEILKLGRTQSTGYSSMNSKLIWHSNELQQIRNNYWIT